jgi:hypothetical protein
VKELDENLGPLCILLQVPLGAMGLERPVTPALGKTTPKPAGPTW